MPDNTDNKDNLGQLEQNILLAVLRLVDDAYGMQIRREIEKRTGREISIGAVYATLERLEVKGYVESSFADPTPERGGRAKKYFKMNPSGEAVLKESLRASDDLRSGIPGYEQPLKI